jgi:hypothetical protein
VALLARPAITATREVYPRGASDVLRVAALVEISAAAAALARTIVRHRHLDPLVLTEHVSSRIDLYAVLGRGRWLPTMTRHVPSPPTGPMPLGLLLPVVADTIASRRRPPCTATEELDLFPTTASGGGS